MTIATPSHRNASHSSYSTRGRRHAMVVPSASTWDGGMPLAGTSSPAAPRTLRQHHSGRVEDSGGTEIRKDARASVILGALFGLTLTFGVVMGAQEDSFDYQPTHSFTVGTAAAAQ